MSAEPTYEYIKGQGWVCFVVPNLIGTGYDGRKYRIVARKPENDEFYMAKKISYYPEFTHGDKSPNLEQFSSCLESYERWELSTWEDGDDYNERFVYVTLIPVDE